MASEPGAGRARLDQLLVARGLAPTRAKAQALVLAGRVWSRGARLDKAGVRLATETPIELVPDARYVSRGAHKLRPALAELRVESAGRDVLDVGASTGGFTQVLLEAGARRVIALDVGRGQLDYTLRRDARVSPLEGCNARYLERAALPFTPSLAVIDVSFISLRLVLPAVVRCLEEPGEVVALVKPQFEVGRGKVGRGGVVRSRALQRDVLVELVGFVREAGWAVVGMCPAALRGAEGNQEYFLHLQATGVGLDPSSAQRSIEGMTSAAVGVEG